MDALTPMRQGAFRIRVGGSYVQPLVQRWPWPDALGGACSCESFWLSPCVTLFLLFVGDEEERVEHSQRRLSCA